MSEKKLEQDVGEVYVKVADIFRMLANEPSVGHFYVQQHVQRAVPNVINFKRQLHAGSSEAKFALDDVQAATSAVRRIKETGPDVISRMITTLNSAMAKLPALKTTPERAFGGFAGAFQPSRRVVEKSDTGKQPSVMSNAGAQSEGRSALEHPATESVKENAEADRQEGEEMETKKWTEVDAVPMNAANRLMQGPGFMVDRAREGGAFVRTMVDTAFVKSGNKVRINSTAGENAVQQSMSDTVSGPKISAAQFMRDMLDGARKAGSSKSKSAVDGSKEARSRLSTDSQGSEQTTTCEDHNSQQVPTAEDRQVALQSLDQPECVPGSGEEEILDVSSGKRTSSNYVYNMLESGVQRANFSKSRTRGQDTGPETVSGELVSDGDIEGSNNRSPANSNRSPADSNRSPADSDRIDPASLRLQEKSGSGRDRSPSQYMRAVFDSAVLTAGTVVQAAGSAAQTAGETAGHVGREGSKLFKVNKTEVRGNAVVEGESATGSWTSQAFENMRRASFAKFGQGNVDDGRKEGKTQGENSVGNGNEGSVAKIEDNMLGGQAGANEGSQTLPSSGMQSSEGGVPSEIPLKDGLISDTKQLSADLEDANKVLAKRLETWLADA